MKVLLTGGYGTIGKYLYNTFVTNNIQVFRFRSTEINLATDNATTELIKRYGLQELDFIIHLAYTKNKQKDILITQNVIKFVKQLERGHLIYMSSWVVCFEETCTLLDPYTKSKLVCEQLCSALANITIVRPSCVLAKGNEWIRTFSKIKCPVEYECFFIHAQQISLAILELLKLEKLPRLLNLFGMKYKLRDLHTICNKLSRSKAISAPGAILKLLGHLAVFNFLRAMMLPNTRINSCIGSPLDFLYNEYNYYLPSSRNELVSLCRRFQNVEVISSQNNTRFFAMNKSNNDSGLGTVCIDTSFLNKIIEFSNDYIIVESGLLLNDLCEYMHRRGKAIETLPEYLNVSIGACVATPVHGSHQVYCRIRDLFSNIDYVDIRQTVVYSVKIKIVDQFYLTRIKQVIPLNSINGRIKQVIPLNYINTIANHFKTDHDPSSRLTVQIYPKDFKCMIWKCYKVNCYGESKSKPPLGLMQCRRYHSLCSLVHPNSWTDASHNIMGSWKTLSLVELGALQKNNNNTRNAEFLTAITSIVNIVKLGIEHKLSLLGIRRSGPDHVWIDIVAAESCLLLFLRRISDSIIVMHSGKWAPLAHGGS